MLTKVEGVELFEALKLNSTCQLYALSWKVWYTTFCETGQLQKKCFNKVNLADILTLGNVIMSKPAVGTTDCCPLTP